MLALLVVGCADSSPPVGTVGHITTYFGGAAAEEPRAVLAARDALSAGGTAADAAVAMYFTLAVTMPAAAGLGGGGVCVVYDRTTNTAEVLDFLPQAPASRAPAGRWAATVPGTVRGMFALNARYGRLRWEQLILPAETMARFGVPAPRALVRSLAGSPVLQDPIARRDFGGPGGQGLGETDMLRRLDLAATLGRIRTGGAGDLYSGGLARAYVEGIAGMGGWITMEDLRDYRPEWRPTLEGRFDNHRVHFPAAPVSGGRVAAAIWSRLGNDSDFADLDPGARARAVATAARDAYGAVWPRPDAAGGSLGFLAIDRNGQAVSCAVTMNRPFGRGRMIPGLGFLAVEPSAEPAATLLGLVPVVISNHNSTQPFMAATGAGDGYAPVAVVTAMLHATAGKQPVAQALAAPRASAGESGPVVEAGAPAPVKSALPGARELPAMGRVLMMYCPDGMTISWRFCVAAPDPRGHGYAVNAER